MDSSRKTLRNISLGLDRRVKSYSSYIINSLIFSTQDSDSGKSTSNCSLRVKGDYYGILTDVSEIAFSCTTI